MSYSVTIGGHTANEHNAKVKEIAEEAWAKLKALHRDDEAAPSLSGWSGDHTGTITLANPTDTGAPAEPAAASSEESGTG